MAVNFSAWSIRKPMPSVVLFIVLCLLGIFSFRSLPITKFPNIDVPVITVSVTQAGAAPAELETQVAKRVEDAIAGVVGIKNIISTLTDGSSVTAAEFRLEIATDRALQDVKDAVAKIRAELPRTIDEPVIQKIDVEGQAILTYAVSSPGKTLEQVSWHVDDVVKRALQGAKGIGKVDRIGGVSREIRVSLDPDRLMALGITAAEVNKQVRATSVDSAGGRGEVGGKEQTIRTLAASRTLESLAATKIVLPGGRDVRLGELGEIRDAYEEPRSFARLDGTTQVVAASVFRSKGASEYDAKLTAEKKIDELRQANPDFTYTIIDDAVRPTYGNYRQAMTTLLEGAVLAVIVVFIFLKDWRATLISAVALPLSIIPTFWVMDVLGFSLNVVSLLGITLVTGILVDDAIVEIENIARHIKMGKSPWRAAMEAADEIGLAVIAISMTIVAIFVPVSFMGGIPGQYFKQFGLTVAIAVLFSLLVARLLTPMLAAYFMRPHKHVEPRDGWIMRSYLALLRLTIHQFTLRLPFRSRRTGARRVVRPSLAYLTVATGLVLFAVSIIESLKLPQGFIPPADEGRTVLSLEMPPSITLADLGRKTDDVVAEIRKMPEVTQVFVVGGASPTGEREVRKAAIYVKFIPKTERKVKQRQLEAQLSAIVGRIPDVRAWYVNERGVREVSLTVASNDPEALARSVASIESAMRREEGFVNVAAAAGVERPELRVTPRFEDASRFGVSTDAIAESIRVATIGDVGPSLAKFNLGDRLIPIRVLLEEGARSDLGLLRAMPVLGSTGSTIPLEAVADVSFGVGPSSIERYNRMRRVVVGTDLIGMTTGEATERIYALPAVRNLPAGVSLLKTGDAEIQDDVFAGFARAMALGIVLVLGVLVLLFGGVFQPLTILMTLPLSIGGVILALRITDNPVSMPVVIGILMLMGIVTKNAIMLVDFAIERQAVGVGRLEALLDAGRKRARPIVMTTIAMVAGMLPSAYAVGDGGEFRAPMAIGVIGGLIVSTALSLVFVPSFYCVMDDLSKVFVWIFGRFVGPGEEAEEQAEPAAGFHDAPPRREPVKLAAE